MIFLIISGPLSIATAELTARGLTSRATASSPLETLAYVPEANRPQVISWFCEPWAPNRPGQLLWYKDGAGPSATAEGQL